VQDIGDASLHKGIIAAGVIGNPVSAQVYESQALCVTSTVLLGVMSGAGRSDQPSTKV
jgi:hypothetical protein